MNLEYVLFVTKIQFFKSFLTNLEDVFIFLLINIKFLVNYLIIFHIFAKF